MIKHFLKFVYSTYEERFQITEMPGYDAFAYRVKQGQNRYGRDKSIGGEEIGVTFWDIVAEPSDIPTPLNSGEQIYFLTHCFQKLLNISKSNSQGFEAKVYYITELNGSEFVNGILDFPKSKTDEYSYIECNVIQDTKTAILERLKNVNIDVFSSIDLDDNPVEPLKKERYLLKALPISQKSNLTTPSPINFTYVSYGLDAYIVNSATQLNEYGVENTFNPYGSSEYLPTSFTTDDAISAINRFKLLVAKETLTNVVIELTNVNLLISDNPGIGTNKNFTIAVGTNPVSDRIQYEIVPEGFADINIVDGSFTINIPQVPRDYTVWLYAGATTSATLPSPTPIGSTLIQMSGMQVEVFATSTTVDVVIDACSYPEFLKAGILRTAGLPFYCPDLEPNGVFGNLYVYNGFMQRSIADKPFYFVFEDEFRSDLRYIGNSDYEITNEIVTEGRFEYYYPNVDLGGFELAAPSTIEKTFNERFQINTQDIEFENYDKDDRSKNTLDSFMTKAQWLFPNRAVDNKIEIRPKKAWDAFEQQKWATQGLRTMTGLDSDNKIAILDTIELSPGTIGTFGARLSQYTSNGQVQIYNSALDGGTDTNSTPVFNWTQLGVKVGDEIEYDVEGESGLTNIILDITNNIITLQPTNYIPIQLGVRFFVFRYVYTDVLLTNRTSEGFDVIDNFESADGCSNMRYSMARMNEYFYSYWNTICSAYPNGTVKNMQFTNNAALTTQFMGGNVLQEGNTIEEPTEGNRNVNEFTDKILSVDQYKTRVICTFERAKELFDTGLKGWIRIRNGAGEIKKVHLADCAMIWSEEILEINRGEVRADDDSVTIESVEGGLLINGTPYDSDSLPDNGFFEINNGYLRVFDNRGFNLFTPVIFEEVLLNGVYYTDEILFNDAMLRLI